MLVQELRHILWANVFPCLQEASCQYTYRVAMRLDKVGHYLGELDLVLEACDLRFRPWQQSG